MPVKSERATMDEKPLLLLVDDDLDFLEMNRCVLEARGFRVTCAFDPDQALGKMALETPRLVITDLMMQSLDSGFTLARAVKEDPRWKGIPVIIVTAVASRLQLDFKPQSGQDLADAHADAFFDKPVRPDALVAKVRELLSRSAPEEPA
ncbi:MAG: response regulator [Pirellulales bacterium]